MPQVQKKITDAVQIDFALHFNKFITGVVINDFSDRNTRFNNWTKNLNIFHDLRRLKTHKKVSFIEA